MHGWVSQADELHSSVIKMISVQLGIYNFACRLFSEFIQFFQVPIHQSPARAQVGRKKEVVVVEICLINTGSQARGSLVSIGILLDFPNFSTLPHCLPSPMQSISEFEIWMVSLQNKPPVSYQGELSNCFLLTFKEGPSFFNLMSHPSLL